ncbi:MAG: DUF6111 family protein [Pseudomonadota bacterium]
MGLLLRVLVFLLPLLVFALWWRARTRVADSESRAQIDRQFRWGLLGSAIFMIAGGLYMMGQGTAPPRGRYIPPHTENGEMVPGAFVPFDQDTSPETETDDPETSPASGP